MRRLLTSFLGLLVLATWAHAQTPTRLRFQTGQVMLYQVEHVTEAVDVTAGNTNQTKSLLKVTKRWQVVGVDATGVATMQMSLVNMYQERTTPSGDVLKYDSANPEKSTPALKEVMAKFLNTPLATIRIDPQGKVVEVKDSKSDASSYENELPFVLVLPTVALKPGEGWDRAYQITLAPPLGTGEKHDAVQKSRCKSLSGDQATLTFTTELKTPPKTAADQVPLWQMLPEGEVVIDTKNGRLQTAKVEIRKEVKDHLGMGSSCKFLSVQTIQYLGDR